jgi:hypothetical protein
VSYFPNDVIDRGVATATAKSDWNANGHIPGRLLRVDMTLVRAVNCSLQLEGLQALTDTQPARLLAVVSCVSCAVCPVAITALMVTRLRALGAISGHSHMVTEQHVGRVPHDTRDGRTELFLDECARCAAAVDRQRRHGDSGKLIGPNVCRRQRP